MCPQVYGLYVVKLALALVLAGGVQVMIYLTGCNQLSKGVWTVCCQAGCCYGSSR